MQIAHRELIKIEIRLTAMDWGLVECRKRKKELHYTKESWKVAEALQELDRYDFLTIADWHIEQIAQAKKDAVVEFVKNSKCESFASEEFFKDLYKDNPELVEKANKLINELKQAQEK